MVSLLLENKQEKEALNMMLVAMDQDFSQVNYLFEVFPKALKNKKLRRLMNDFRDENNY